MPKKCKNERGAARAMAIGAALTIFCFATLTMAGIASAAQTKNAKKTASLPYTTIDHPQFVSASQASFLGSKDMVLGVTDGKVAKAYPSAILAQHGVVQDQMSDGPIAVTW